MKQQLLQKDAKLELIPDEINQEILLQVIHPQILNSMKGCQHILKLNQDLMKECISVIQELDKLCPYTVRFVFVSSYYADKVTAIDFMSRLGNFQSLKDYSHYFCG